MTAGTAHGAAWLAVPEVAEGVAEEEGDEACEVRPGVLVTSLADGLSMPTLANFAELDGTTRPNCRSVEATISGDPTRQRTPP